MFTRDHEEFEIDELIGISIGSLFGDCYLVYQQSQKALSDKDEIQKLSKKLQFQAFSDYLTELPNRRFLEAYVEDLIIKSNLSHSEFSLLYLDLDGFKYINDTLGHSTGDKLLRLVTKRLLEVMPTNALLVRLDGDEFCMLIQETVNDTDCRKRCKELLNTLNKPFYIDEHKLLITQTIGISRYPNDGPSLDVLLKNADLAMHRGKKQENEPINFYHERLSKDIQKRFIVQHGLEEAIA